MALDKTSMISSLQSLFASMHITPMSDNDFATNVANIIDTYVKTATVSVPGTGLVSSSGGGPVTGESTTGNLS